MKNKYACGHEPMIGDLIEQTKKDDEYDYLDWVVSVNNNGTINIYNGLGVVHECDPSQFHLLNRRADAIDINMQVLLNGMSHKEFNRRLALFFEENNLEIVKRN